MVTTSLGSGTSITQDSYHTHAPARLVGWERQPNLEEAAEPGRDSAKGLSLGLAAVGLQREHLSALRDPPWSPKTCAGVMSCVRFPLYSWPKAAKPAWGQAAWHTCLNQARQEGRDAGGPTSQGAFAHSPADEAQKAPGSWFSGSAGPCLPATV